MPEKVLQHPFLALRKAAHFLLEVLIFFSVFVISWLRPFFWAMRLLGREKAAEALSHWLMGCWCRGVFKVLGCRVVVEGREHLPADSAYVVMSNHQSNYDPILLLGFLHPSLSFIAKRELFRVPGLAFWLRHNRCLRLDRGDVRGGADALVAYGRELKMRRGRVAMFPEGSRTKHPRREIQRFMGGSLMLALENGLPVVPVALDGTRLAGTRASLVGTPRRGRLIRLRIMAPIMPPIMEGENSPAERRRLMKELRQAMVSNWEAIRVEWPVVGPPPA
ncbi:MAG: lysophospholipid acyltransferase family protein [bacterium]